MKGGVTTWTIQRNEIKSRLSRDVGHTCKAISKVHLLQASREYYRAVTIKGGRNTEEWDLQNVNCDKYVAGRLRTFSKKSSTRVVSPRLSITDSMLVSRNLVKTKAGFFYSNVSSRNNNIAIKPVKIHRSSHVILRLQLGYFQCGRQNSGGGKGRLQSDGSKTV